MTFDVIVVGTGVQGLSTGRYLAKNGAKTLILDQYPVFHSNGSSYGKSRGIRHTYEEFHYSQMVAESLSEWRELEKETNISLFEKTGIVCLCSKEEQSSMRNNLKLLHLKHELLSSAQIESRFQGFLTCGMSGIFEAEAGVLKADHCLRAFQNSYLKAKGSMRQERVLNVLPLSTSTVHVTTEQETYVCKSVVLTCGPWINDLLKPLQLSLPIKVIRTLITYWKARNPDAYSRKNNFPLTCISNPNTLLYTSPALEYSGYMKIGFHGGVELKHPSEKSQPLTLSQLNQQSEQIKQMTNVITKHYPHILPVPASLETCLYTMTPDSEFILDKHPAYKNVVIGTGFSGHGFKMAPIIGSILGDLALGNPVKFPLHHYSALRFKKDIVPKPSM